MSFAKVLDLDRFIEQKDILDEYNSICEHYTINLPRSQYECITLLDIISDCKLNNEGKNNLKSYDY